MDDAIGAVCSAVAAADAADPAQFLTLVGVILRSASDHLCTLEGNDNGQLLGANVDAGSAADAQFVVHQSGAVGDLDGVEAASSSAVAEASAAEGAVTVQIQSCSFTAVGSAGSSINLVIMQAAAATHESDSGLDLSQIVIGIDDDLLAAGNSTCCAAQALLIVDHSAVVHDADGILGASLCAVTTADAAVATHSDSDFLFVLVGAGNEVGDVIGNHVDELLGACSNAVAAAVALVLVELDSTVNDSQRALGACCHAGTCAHATVGALAAGKTSFDCFLTGSVELQTGLSGCATRTLDKGDFMLFIHGLHSYLTSF